MVPFRGFFPCLLLIYLAFQIRNTSSALTGILMTLNYYIWKKLLHFTQVKKKIVFVLCVFQISFQLKSCRSNIISGYCDCTFWIISYKKNLKGKNCSPQNDCIFLLVTLVTHKNHGYT